MSLEQIRQDIQHKLAQADVLRADVSSKLDELRRLYGEASRLAQQHGLVFAHHARSYEDLQAFVAENPGDREWESSESSWNHSGCTY